MTHRLFTDRGRGRLGCSLCGRPRGVTRR
ncbi:MAG: hypothetical protein JSR66_00130 [Proteobacteria bacterium]|nr:hypothetical protein [Pseudomonadota bacterium]